MGYGLDVEGHTLKIETLKLLVQLAWADHEVSENESEYILSLAKKFEVSDDEIKDLKDALTVGGTPPMPNLGLLRGHYVLVMQSIDEIIAIDDRIVDDERELRDMVAQMLTEE